MSDIPWTCPNCDALHRLDPRYIGHSIRCMKCKRHEPIKNWSLTKWLRIDLEILCDHYGVEPDCGVGKSLAVLAERIAELEGGNGPVVECPVCGRRGGEHSHECQFAEPSTVRRGDALSWRSR